ncbi:hypothetical protein P7H17_06765 [Paenibacillus larvae]|nr:hypothetical protein [Paenibacillus larvae]MDT2285855.1 hypothetical protein [Paenibacillus larvae]
MVEEDVWYTRKPQKGLSFNETNGDTSSDSQKEKGIMKKEVCVVSDNVLNRDFHATRPNEKWVTDITLHSI